MEIRERYVLHWLLVVVPLACTVINKKPVDASVLHPPALGYVI